MTMMFVKRTLVIAMWMYRLLYNNALPMTSIKTIARRKYWLAEQKTPPTFDRVGTKITPTWLENQREIKLIEIAAGPVKTRVTPQQVTMLGENVGGGKTRGRKRPQI